MIIVTQLTQLRQSLAIDSLFICEPESQSYHLLVKSSKKIDPVMENNTLTPAAANLTQEITNRPGKVS